MITTGGLSALLIPDLKKVYVEEGKEFPLEYPLWANVEDMDWQGEKDRQVSALGTMPTKSQGQPFKTDEPIDGSNKTYTAFPFGLAIEVSWEMWRDDLYGFIVQLIQGLARAARNRQEVDAHKVLNRAFNTSFAGFVASEALVQRTHTLLDGSTLNNTPATSQSFGATYLQGMVQRFHQMTGHRGLPRLMAPRMIIITQQNLFTAREILGSSNKPFTADNEINSLLQEDLMWMVNHYITTSAHHHTLARQGEHDLNFRWRDHEIFDMFDDPRTKVAVATAYQRHTVGTFGAWEGIDSSGN